MKSEKARKFIEEQKRDYGWDGDMLTVEDAMQAVEIAEKGDGDDDRR